MKLENDNTPSIEQYILVALIDIYRGLEVRLPVALDIESQHRVMRDVLSTAIGFATKQESMQVISDELYLCAKEGCTLQQQIQVIQKQSPDVLNAKMTASAYMLKLLNKEMNIQ